MTENNIIKQKYESFRRHIENSTETTLKSEMYILTTLERQLKNKPFKKAEEKDIIEYLKKYSNKTKDTRIIFLKKFYRWLFDIEKGERLPDCIRRIKTTVKSPMHYYNDTKYRERVITEEEYEKLIAFSQKIMHKAIIETLYNFGCRASELLSMNANHVSYDGKITKITVTNSKSIPRDIVYKGRSKILLQWYESYQHFKGQKNKPLWTNYQKNKHNRYTINGLEKAITVISKRAGLRHITAHDMRHTAITNSRNQNIPLTHLETNYGFTHGSTMIRIYDHNKTKDYEKWLDQKQEESNPTYELVKEQRDKAKNKEKEIDDLKEEMKEMRELITSLSSTILPFFQKKALKEFNENPNKQTTEFKLDVKKYNP
jgi:integrase